MATYGMRDGVFSPKKLKIEGKVPMRYHIPYIFDASTTALVSAWDVSAGTTAKLDKHLTTQPPYAMEICVNAAAAGGTSAAGVLADGLIFKGYDAQGNYIREVVQIASAATGLTYSSNAFAKITSITPDSASHSSTDVNIGYRQVFGLPYPVASSGDILGYAISNVPGTASALPTVDAKYGNITPASAITAGSTVTITYLSKFQE